MEKIKSPTLSQMQLCHLVTLLHYFFIFINILTFFFFSVELTEHPLSLYIEEFEKPYLVHTRRYYERESATVIANASISEYMKKA